jgi:hypothetical protein
MAGSSFAEARRARSRPWIGVGALAGLALAGSWSLHALADTYSEPAGIPRLIPFHARLDQSGVPVSGSVTATFELYDSMAGGTRLWGPETHPSRNEQELSVMLALAHRSTTSSRAGRYCRSRSARRSFAAPAPGSYALREELRPRSAPPRRICRAFAYHGYVDRFTVTGRVRHSPASCPTTTAGGSPRRARPTQPRTPSACSCNDGGSADRRERRHTRPASSGRTPRERAVGASSPT